MTRYRRTTIEDLIEEQRSDPRYDTNRDAYSLDDLIIRKFGGSRETIPLATPGSGRKLPGVVGYFDLSEYFNESNTTSSITEYVSNSHREHYHPPAPKFLDPLQDIEDWYTIQTYSTPLKPFQRPSWSPDADAPPENSWYWSSNLHTPDWGREAVADQIDPTDVHDQQQGLSEFEDVTQAEVNPDALDPEDARLKDLPAFIDADERDDCLNKYDPAKNSVKSQCDHCGGEDPWLVPLERGVHGVRDGDIREGNPDYSQCEPEERDIKYCSCCGCPLCGAKSISHRKTRSPSYRCNTCELEFEHPIELPTGEGERSRLYWRCKHCRKPTKAPFPGIPTELLDDRPTQ